MGFKLYQEVIDHSQAKGAAYQVHVNLALRADDGTRQYRASIERIARETRLPRRTVEYGLQGLRGLHHIASNRRGSKKGINLFTFPPTQPAIIADLQPAAIADSPTHNPQPLRIVGQTTRNGCVQEDKIRKQRREERPAGAGSASLKVIQFQKPIKPTSTVKLTDAEFIAELKKNPAYRHIDIDRELGKMDAWLLTPRARGRSKTRDFAVNWLNRIEAPMQPGPKPIRDPVRDVVL